MKTTTMMHTRVPKKLRDEAKKVANELGISMSLIVEQALRNLTTSKQLIIENPLVPTPYLKSILKEAEENRDKPEHRTEAFESVDDAITHLKNL